MPARSEAASHGHWTGQLAESLVGHPVGDYPLEVRRQAARVVADSCAAILGGLGEAEIAMLATRTPPGTQASLIGLGRSAGVQDAAFFNSVAGCALELDEGNYSSGGHPGIHVVPVALACGEMFGCSGRVILDAVIIGYEVASRIGRACKPHPSIHSNGTWGTLGAAATVARLRGFDAAQMRAVLCVASSLCAATSCGTSKAGASVRSVYAGLSARAGILACDLVECGFTGEDAGIETMFGRVLGSAFDPAAAISGWAEFWEITRNFYKFDACCKETQGALQAVDDLLAQRGVAIRPEHITEIRVETFDEAASLDVRHPPSALSARFSIPFVVASRLIHGHTGVSSEEVGLMLADPSVQALASRVRVMEDPALTLLVPEARVTRMRISTIGNETYELEVTGSLGDFDKSFDLQILEEKFVRCEALSPMRRNARAVFHALLDMEAATDIRAIMAMLR